MHTQIDFGYAFGTPHRLCVSLPDSGLKGLVDVSETDIKVSWSDEDLAAIPLGAFASPRIHWNMTFTAQENAVDMKCQNWRRYQNRYPALECQFVGQACVVRALAVAGSDALVVRFEAENRSDADATIRVDGMIKQFCFNHQWMEEDSQHNAIFPHMGDRADRVVAFGLGGDDNAPKTFRDLGMQANVAPGATTVFYTVMPRRIFIDDLEAWYARDWEAYIDLALSPWTALFDRCVKVRLPDPVMEDAFYACFADIFVMRERAEGGYMAGVAGSEVYRATNVVEPTIAARLLTQFGFAPEAYDMMQVLFAFQEENGRWDDPRRWGHHMFWPAYYRTNFYLRYHELTGDKDFLLKAFDPIIRHCRYIAGLRPRTKVLDEKGEKVLYYGMLPRSMGDGGLMDGEDYYGHFFIASVAHCAMLKDVATIATILQEDDVAKDMMLEFDDLWACTREAMERGAIQEDGYRWIPGVPGKTTGSRFGAVLSFTETFALHSPFDEIAEGTMRHLTKVKGEGGIPLGLGWMPQGVWVSMALDQLAQAHLARGEVDEAADYLARTLNHSTPLFTWCEERLPEPGATTISGDRQHTWTPNAYLDFLTNAMVSQKDGALHIGRVIPRNWLAPGESFSVSGLLTAFGKVDVTVEAARNRLTVDVAVEKGHLPCETVVVHVRTAAQQKGRLSAQDAWADSVQAKLSSQGCIHLEIELDEGVVL